MVPCYTIVFSFAVYVVLGKWISLSLYYKLYIMIINLILLVDNKTALSHLAIVEKIKESYS